MRTLFGAEACSPRNILERQNVRETVEFERYCRDYALWEEMERLFTPDSRVRISWFEGSGKNFVAASRKMAGACHKIHNTVAQVEGNRAAAEIIAQIHSRSEIEGVLCDLVSYVRLLYRLKKERTEWKIFSIDCIYEKDSLLQAVPGDVPKIDGDALRKLRPSYRCLSYVLGKMGAPINAELPGEDRPETVDALYDDCREWLYQKPTERKE